MSKAVTATAGRRSEQTKPGEFIDLHSGGEVRIDSDNPSYGWVTCPDCPKPEERFLPLPHGKKWSEYTGRCVGCAHRKYDFPMEDDTLPNGSVVHWSKRSKGNVPVSGACGHDHLADAYQALASGFTGLCAECYHRGRKRTGDEPIGKEGSILHYDIPDPADPNKRAVTCGRCEKTWYATPQFGEENKKWSGLCPECKPRKYTGERTLPKGTKALFDKRKVVPSPSGKRGLRYKVAIQCRGCFEETGEEKDAWLCVIIRYLKGQRKWKELCHECLRKSGALRRLKNEKTAPSGTRTLFQVVNEKDEVQIIYALCGCDRWTPWDNAATNWKTWGDACPIHNTPEERAKLLAERMLAEMVGRTAGTDSGQEEVSNGITQKSGRKPAFTDEEGFKAIDKLGWHVSVSQLARTLGCARWTVNNFARRNGYRNLEDLVEARRAGRV